MLGEPVGEPAGLEQELELACYRLSRQGYRASVVRAEEATEGRALLLLLVETEADAEQGKDA